MATNRKITIFLASSEELINDRNSFSDLIRSLDNIYEDRGIRIKLQKWEDFFAYCTGTRTQNQYNQVLSASDMCICLFHKRAGQYTVEEFRHAIAEYQRTGDHPKTYVYVRALVEGEVEEEELKQFKDELFKQMGHYWCNYATEDSMKLHFVMQFEHLLNRENVRGLDSNIKVERGNVLLYGKKVADYTNIPFAANNADIKALQANIVSLNNQIAKLRAEDASLNIINPIVEKRNEYQKQLDQLEKQLLDMAISINKTISSGEPINERKRRAIEMFEKGNHKEVDRILNAEDIKADCKRSKNRIALIEQKRAEFDALMAAEKEAEIQRLRSSVDDYILKAKNIMTMYSNPNRFNEACHWYEEAIQETRSGLPEVDLAKRLFDYGMFLQDNKRFNRIETYYNEALEIRERLASAHPEAYEADVAMTLNNLANLYSDTQRINDAEAYYLRALEIRERLASTHPEAYEADVAMTLNNLANLYSNTQRINDAEAYYLRALEIRERLASAHPEAYEADVADTLKNLAILYYDTQRINDAEAYYLRALEIYERLASAHPEAYESDVAMTLNNLAALYYETQRINDAEAYYLRALEIYERLFSQWPDLYASDVHMVQKNLRILEGVKQGTHKTSLSF